MRKIIYIFLFFSAAFTLGSCEIEDSQQENLLLSKGWEFTDVKASKNGRDISSSVYNSFEKDFGLIYSFYDDGTFSVDMDDTQYETGDYEFDSSGLILNLNGDLYDVTISESLLVLSYSYYNRGEIVNVRLFHE